MLRVDTAFGGSLTFADAGKVLVDFLADCEVSLELCILRFLLLGNRHPGPLIPMRFCSLYHCVSPVHSRPSVQSVLPCICRKAR
jgi:hypothetical protein